MRRGPYLALSRREVRDLVDDIGGDLAGALIVLAASAAPDTGLLRGGLDDIREILGCGRKRTRTILTQLDELGLVEWTPGRGPGKGEGQAIVSALDRLDARPQPKPARHGLTGSPQPTEPKPARHGLEDEPVPNPCPNPSPTRPATARVTRGNAPQTGDRRQETSSHTSELTQVRTQITQRAGKIYTEQQRARGLDIRSPEGFAAKCITELEANASDHLAELAARAARCTDHGQTLDLNAFAAVALDPDDVSARRRLAAQNPDPELDHDPECPVCDGDRFVNVGTEDKHILAPCAGVGSVA